MWLLVVERTHIVHPIKLLHSLLELVKEATSSNFHRAGDVEMLMSKVTDAKVLFRMRRSQL